MILVDTSVWIDHLHRGDRRLSDLLVRDQVGTHPLVIEELGLGTIGRREEFLASLGRLRRFPVVAHAEARALVEERRLWGRGLSAVDVHLLAGVILAPGSALWTRDRRLAAAATEVGVSSVRRQ